MASKSTWDDVAALMGKPGYEIMSIHHEDLGGGGIWDPDVVPGSLVRLVKWSGDQLWSETGMLLKWGNGASSIQPRIQAQVLANEHVDAAGQQQPAAVVWFDHTWNIEKL
jgi:hypothetical protein